MKLPKSMGDQIPESQWEVESYSADGFRRTDIAWVDRERGLAVRRTVNLAEDPLLEANKALFNDSDGKRWGDGQVAARIPLNVFFQDVAPRLKEGDHDFTKWWINNPNHLPYRTFKGRV
jgi:hypothetical protein